MSEKGEVDPEIEKIKDFVNDNRLDDAVQIIALYLGDANEEDYLERLESVIETLLLLHGGQTVIRFLMENLIIDLPSLLENLSKKDSVLRYSFLLLLKPMCRTECNLFLSFSDQLLNSEDPNVREAYLQLLIFMTSGETIIDDESLIKAITLKLTDEKDFVVEKAIQVLKGIGKENASLVTRILSNYVKEEPENEELKGSVDNILKAIVSVEKIDEIVEDEGEEVFLEKEEEEILDKELELKKKEIEIKKKKLELEEKEKQLEEKIIQEKEKSLKEKEELLAKESELSQVEIELTQKKIKEKEQKLREEELKRAEKKLEELEKEADEKKGSKN